MMSSQAQLKTAYAVALTFLNLFLLESMFRIPVYAQYVRSQHCDGLRAEAQDSKKREAESRISLERRNRLVIESKNRIRLLGIQASRLYRDGQHTVNSAILDQVLAVAPGRLITSPQQASFSQPSFRSRILKRTPFLGQLYDGINSISDLVAANREMKTILRRILKEKTDIAVEDIFIKADAMTTEKEPSYRLSLLSQFRQDCLARDSSQKPVAAKPHTGKSPTEVGHSVGKTYQGPRRVRLPQTAIKTGRYVLGNKRIIILSNGSRSCLLWYLTRGIVDTAMSVSSLHRDERDPDVFRIHLSNLSLVQINSSTMSFGDAYYRHKPSDKEFEALVLGSNPFLRECLTSRKPYGRTVEIDRR